MQIEKLYDGAYLLHGEVGGRPLHLPLLVEGGCALLMDTGCRQHVDDLILPALQQLSLPLSSLKMIVSTHCDFDHVGGNHRMKELAPQASLCCGDADRREIESPEYLYRTRYDANRSQGIFYPDDVRAWIMQCLDKPQAVDQTFHGGEMIPLGPERPLQMLRLAGHSRGHLAILDQTHRALFAADALHGSGYLDLEGRPSLCPTYLYPSEYVQTSHTVEGLEVELYSGCHWPVMRGEEIALFCKESRDFVQRAAALIFEALKEPHTLRELCFSLGPELGQWPSDAHIDLCYAISGHLEELLADGAIEVLPASEPSRYQRRSADATL